MNRCEACQSTDVEERIVGHSFVDYTDSGQLRFLRCKICLHEQLIPVVDLPSDNDGASSALHNSAANHASAVSQSCVAVTCSNVLQVDRQDSTVSTLPRRRERILMPCSSSVNKFPASSLDGSGGAGKFSHPKRSASVGNVSVVSTEKSSMHDLKHLTDTLYHQPCNNCYAGRLEAVDGIKGIYYCPVCHVTAGFDDTMNHYDLLEFLVYDGDYEMEACQICGNKDPNEFTLQLRDGESTATSGDGEVKCIVQCSVCFRMQQDLGEIEPIEYALSSVSKGIPDSGDGSNSGRTQVFNLSWLAAGDHIAWHQVLAYWHHALVIEVSGSWVNVIHYNGPDPVYKGVVVDEWLEIDPASCQLYRYDYRAEDCYPVQVAIERARLRINESSYHLFTSNCEHFVRWCKTGHHRSLQVESFADTVKRRTNDVLSATGRVLASSVSKVSGLSNLVSEKTVRISLANANTVAKSFGDAGSGMAVAEVKQAAQSVAPSALKFAGVAVTMLLEVGAVCRDIKRAQEQRAAGDISRNEFLKVTIKRTCEGAGSIAGMAIVLPLPHSWIGIPLAALVGQGAGALLGRYVGTKLDKHSRDL